MPATTKTQADETSEEPKRQARGKAAAPEVVDGPASIPARLAEIRSRVSHVAKDSRNEHHQYDYASWGNVLSTVRGHLDDLGLFLHLSVQDVETITPAGNVLVTLKYAWVCTTTGERLEGVWAGVGYDKAGDKAIYKAYSGGLKYLILDTFLIPTGDDPEAGPQAEEARRSAAVPRIPRERAERIVEAAKSAGLGKTHVEAKLAEVGARRVVDLTVDQAEAVEAFVRDAAQKAATSGDATGGDA